MPRSLLAYRLWHLKGYAWTDWQFHPYWDSSFYPHRRSLHFIPNLCTKSYASSSQHTFCGRHHLVPQLRFFWWGIRVTKILPRSLQQGVLCYMNLIWPCQIWHQVNESFIRGFGERRAPFVNWERSTNQGKLKDLCHVDSDPLPEGISNSLNAEAVRLLAAIFRSSKHKPRGRRWNWGKNFGSASTYA